MVRDIELAQAGRKHPNVSVTKVDPRRTGGSCPLRMRAINLRRILKRRAVTLHHSMSAIAGICRQVHELRIFCGAVGMPCL